MDALPPHMLPEANIDVPCEQLFFDFLGRRTGILKALTTERNKFFQLCDPDAENPVCLSGLPDDTWKVGEPLDELPEAMVGINFVRDKMERHDWLAKVAVMSEAWLYEVAFYYAGRFGFDSSKRKQLFALINAYPTVYENILIFYSTQKSESVQWAMGRSRPRRYKKIIAKAERRKEKGDIERKGEEEGPEVEQEVTVNYFGAPGETQYRGGSKYQNAKCGGCGKKFGPGGPYFSCVACGHAFHAECTPPFTPENAEHFENNICPDCFEKQKHQPARS